MSDWRERLLTRPRLAIDMDHVMADMGAALVDWLAQEFGLPFEDGPESFGTLPLKLDDPQRQAMIDRVADGEMFRDLPVFPGCQDVLEELNTRYAVLIVTAAMEYPRGIPPKIEWLETHFPFLDPLQFVFCGPKQSLAVDYLLDDSVKHFSGFQGKPVLYSAPHNLDETDYDRVDNWSDVADYFLKD